jgi:N-acetylglucosaminyldiphosphoundecaprenol N-acetyl-beta-D-mannosaminyltransferase
VTSKPASQLRATRLRVLTPPATTEHFSLLGVEVAASGFDEMVGLIIESARQKHRVRVHFAAMHTFIEASRDAELLETLRDADVVAPDGMPLVWLGRLKGKRAERICGPDTMLAVLDRSREHGQSHFFYGGSPEVVETLAETMSERFPGLKVVGAHSPPYRSLSWSEVEDTVRMINEADPDYVWVGLGSPKQDQWLAAFRPLLHAPVLLAVGAAFDFHAGTLTRAPGWAQRAGLEWLFRLASEPRRLAWRYIRGAGSFAMLLLAELLNRRKVTE